MEENSKISKNQEVPVEIKQSKDISENEQTEKEDINLFFKKLIIEKSIKKEKKYFYIILRGQMLQKFVEKLILNHIEVI